MKTVVIEMEIEIPSGYGLAEPKPRKAMVGERYLDIRCGEVCVNKTRCETVLKYPILHKVWQPEVDKWYFCSNDKCDVGTTNGRLLEISSFLDGCYIDSNDQAWGYCWPVPDAVIIGK